MVFSGHMPIVELLGHIVVLFLFFWEISRNIFLCEYILIWKQVVKASDLELVKGPTGEGNGSPLQYSCLENPVDGGAWKAAAHGVAKSWTWLSDFTFTFHFHALENEMATHSSVLAWRIPGMGAWWAAVYGVAQSRTRLMWLSSSSSKGPTTAS